MGCFKDIASGQLHKHERRCQKFRDYMDALHTEDARMRRLQASAAEKQIAEMESRLDLQVDLIDELEEQLEELEESERQYEIDRQAARVEQTKLLRSLESVTGPLYGIIRSLDTMYTKVASVNATLRNASRGGQAPPPRRRPPTAESQSRTTDRVRAPYQSPRPSRQSSPNSLPPGEEAEVQGTLGHGRT